MLVLFGCLHWLALPTVAALIALEPHLSFVLHDRDPSPLPTRVRNVWAGLALLDLLLMGPLTLPHYPGAPWRAGIYLAGVLLLFELSLRGARPLPAWLLPATGVWARRLLAFLAVLCLLVAGPLVTLPVFTGGPPAAALLISLGTALYCLPAWWVLARGRE